MYDELINSLRICGKIRSADDYCVAFHDGCCEAEPVCMYELMMKAADAIEELSAKVDSLQLYVDSISKLPDCNTCLKNGTCEFRPKLGEYCRINCHAWVERLPKEG